MVCISVCEGELFCTSVNVLTVFINIWYKFRQAELQTQTFWSLISNGVYSIVLYVVNS